MDEYLRRQRHAAEHHIQQANHQLLGKQAFPATELFPASSVPATPTGTRRHNGDQRRDLSASPGGSLERRGLRVAPSDTGAFSDTEYGRLLLGSPMANRRSYGISPNGSPQQPGIIDSHPPGSPLTGKRDAVFGSRSLPKGASSLNYGLMVDRIQQKRQHRQLASKANDGSLSDSNYATFGDLNRQQQQTYAWMGPASTYVHDP